MNNTYAFQTYQNSSVYSYSCNFECYSEVRYLSSEVENISKELLIPISILKQNSSLEAIVLYLKDIMQLRYNEIAILLNRDQRTIWVTYANSKKKKITLDLGSNEQIVLPVDIFISRKLSILESIVIHLRSVHLLSFNQISELLGKNYRTIFTVYKRALKKLGNEN